MQREKYGNQDSLDAKKRRGNSEKRTELRFQQIDELMRSVREGNAHGAVKVMQRRISDGPSGRISDRLQEYRYDLVLLMALMGQTLREEGVEEHYIDQVHTDSIQKIHAAETEEQAEMLYGELAEIYCDLKRKKEYRNFSPVVRQVIREVDLDLSLPLTLSYFAELLNVNPSYLSSLFHRDTGQSVTDYVTGRRIRHAASLLQFSSLPIKTIAEQVGIKDVQYFTRLFKKNTGRTPREYRENMTREEPKTSSDRIGNGGNVYDRK